MRDPTRLLAGAGSDFERQLLAPASTEAMPEEIKLRMQEGLGLAGEAAGAGVLAGKLGLLAWTSAAVLAVGFGGGVLGARIFSTTTSAPAPAGISVPALARALAPAPVAPASAGALPGEAEGPSPATRRAAAPSRPAPARVDLREEIALIDGAREAVAQRAPARALDLLQRYGARHPRGAFAPEAIALRIEALEQSGDHEQAVALARRFAAAHPDSPLAQRIERLVR